MTLAVDKVDSFPSSGAAYSWLFTPNVSKPTGILAIAMYHHTSGQAQLITGMTYGGQAMTKISDTYLNVASGSGIDARAVAYYLPLNTLTGAQTLAVQKSGTPVVAGMSAMVVSYTADTTLGIEPTSFSIDQATSGSASVSDIKTQHDAHIVAAGATPNLTATSDTSPTAPLVDVLEDDWGSHMTNFGQIAGISSPGTYNTNWAYSGSTRWGVFSIAIAEARARTRSWTQGAASGANLTGGAGAWDGGRYIYRLGSTATGGIFHRYDIETDTWTALTSIPGNVYRIFHGSAVVDGKVYIVGGWEGVGAGSGTEAFNPLRIYDIETDTWSTGTTPPRFIIGTLHASIDSVVTTFDIDETATMVFDGASSGTMLWIDNEGFRVTSRTLVSGNRYTYTVVRHTSGSSAASHTAGTNVNGGGFHVGGYWTYPGCVGYNGKLYVFGGFGCGSNEAVDNRLSSYDPATDTWTQLEVMPAGSDEGMGLIIDGKLHAFGNNIDGVDDDTLVVYPNGSSGTQENAHQVYDFDTDTWELFNNLRDPDDRGRVVEAFQIVVAYDPNDGVLWAFVYQNSADSGGQTDKYVYRWNPGDDTWEADGNIDAPGFSAVVQNVAAGSYHLGRIVFMFDDVASPTSFPGILYSGDLDFEGGTAGFDEYWDVLSGKASNASDPAVAPLDLPGLSDVDDAANTGAATQDIIVWDGTQWVRTSVLSGGAP